MPLMVSQYVIVLHETLYRRSLTVLPLDFWGLCLKGAASGECNKKIIKKRNEVVRCHPQPCHGDVLLELIKEYSKYLTMLLIYGLYKKLIIVYT
jgi:hypothetical protein